MFKTFPICFVKARASAVSNCSVVVRIWSGLKPQTVHEPSKDPNVVVGEIVGLTDGIFVGIVDGLVVGVWVGMSAKNEVKF